MQFFILCPDCGEELSSLNTQTKLLQLTDGMIKKITVKRYRCLKCRLRVDFRFVGKYIMVSAYLLDERYWEEFTFGERL